MDVKLAANWLMGDIVIYFNEEKLSTNESKLTSQELAKLISFIQNGT